MKRMKTFLIYALLILGFFALSLILENGLLIAMYSSIEGDFDGYYSLTDSSFNAKNMKAKACNVNGYMNFDLVNSTGNFIDNCFLKIELYNERNLLSGTEYVQISNMDLGETKTYNIKFKANNIEKYYISVVPNVPDKTNIINILGWEIDLTNVFGLGIDLSNVSIFGTKLTDLFKWSNIKSTGHNFWIWFIQIASGVPWWGYLGGWLFFLGLL